MKTTFASRVNSWLMRTIYIQLYLSLMSSPILIYWGLPVSMASPLGNILFNPLLVLFLFFSSLLFFTELFCIPNAFFALLLNYCTKSIDYSIGFGSQGWLVGFAKPPILFLWLIPIATLLVVHYRYNRKRWAGVISLCLLSIAISTFLMYSNHPCPVQMIPCNNGSLTLISTDSSTVLIDPGYLGSRISAPSYIQYTLVPTIIKNGGTLTIDALVLLKLNLTTLLAVSALCQQLTIHTVYFPEMQGSLSEQEREQWNQLATVAAARKISLLPISGPCSLRLDNQQINIKPQQRKMHYNNLLYNAILVEITIDGHLYKWCSAGYHP